jgi:hypothetical protein
MAHRTISYHQLVCDGCKTVFGEGVYYSSTIESRAAAYNEGWRFPERCKVAGGLSKTVNDVCPKCAEGWVRQPALNVHAVARARRDEWKATQGSEPDQPIAVIFPLPVKDGSGPVE